jgi:hypothetical protein
MPTTSRPPDIDGGLTLGAGRLFQGSAPAPCSATVTAAPLPDGPRGTTRAPAAPIPESRPRPPRQLGDHRLTAGATFRHERPAGLTHQAVNCRHRQGNFGSGPVQKECRRVSMGSGAQQPAATRRATSASTGQCARYQPRQAHPLRASHPRPSGPAAPELHSAQRHAPPRPTGPGCARYAPGQTARERVSAGQGPAQQPSPEPCAQVRILPGALLRSMNSNTLTTLGRLGASPVTCGSADAFSILRPVRPPAPAPSPRKPQLTGTP